MILPRKERAEPFRRNAQFAQNHWHSNWRLVCTVVAIILTRVTSLLRQMMIDEPVPTVVWALNIQILEQLPYPTRLSPRGLRTWKSQVWCVATSLHVGTMVAPWIGGRSSYHSFELGVQVSLNAFHTIGRYVHSRKCGSVKDAVCFSCCGFVFWTCNEQVNTQPTVYYRFSSWLRAD